MKLSVQHGCPHFFLANICIVDCYQPFWKLRYCTFGYLFSWQKTRARIIKQVKQETETGWVISDPIHPICFFSVFKCSEMSELLVSIQIYNRDIFSHSCIEREDVCIQKKSEIQTYTPFDLRLTFSLQTITPPFTSCQGFPRTAGAHTEQ